MVEIKDLGFIVKSSHYNESEYLIQVLTENHGKWSGICTMRSTAPIVSSYIYMNWKGKSEASLGKIKLEWLEIAPGVHFWNEKLVLATILAICDSASKFIPDREQSNQDFKAIYQAFTQINQDNFLQILMDWERHLISRHFGYVWEDKPFAQHIKSTSYLNTDARMNLLVLLG